MNFGGCLCGAVRFQIQRNHLGAFNCYCAMCRKAHGGGYSTHIPLRRDQFELVEGTLTTYASSASGRREFCARCGTHILVHGQTEGDSVAVPAGTLDGDPPVEIVGHIFAKDCVGWQAIPQDAPIHEAWPPGVTVPEADR